MTDHDDDLNPQGQPADGEADGDENTDQIGDDEPTVDADDGAAAGEGGDDQKKDDEPAKDPKDEQIEALKQQVQEMNGRVGGERGQRNVLLKVIKQLESTEGVVDRKALAESLGMEQSRLDGILDSPSSDDNAAFGQRCNLAEKNLKAVQSVLKKNGQNVDDVIQTYGTLLNISPEERDRFMSLSEDQLVDHILSVATEQGGKVKRLRDSKGNILDALSSSETRIAELEAENAELRKGGGQRHKTRVPLNTGSVGASANAGEGRGEFTRSILG